MTTDHPNEYLSCVFENEPLSNYLQWKNELSKDFYPSILNLFLYFSSPYCIQKRTTWLKQRKLYHSFHNQSHKLPFLPFKLRLIIRGPFEEGKDLFDQSPKSTPKSAIVSHALTSVYPHALSIFAKLK
jgi:hypothetical protein